MKKLFLIFIGVVVGVCLSGGVMGQVNTTHTGTIASFSTWTHTNCVQGNASSNDYIQMLTATSLVKTPVMDFTAFTSLKLDFKARTFGGPSAAQATITVSISTNNGSSWTSLGTRTPGSTTLTSMTQFDLSAYTGTQVFIKLETLGAGSSKGVGVDDILVSGTSASCTAPSTQATSFGTNTITSSSMNVAFTRGNGTGGVLVVARSGGAVNADPVSGTTYAANSIFGSGNQIGTGNYIVYNGTANGVSAASGNLPVTGLTANTTYHYAVYEYNTTSTCYHLTELTGNATTTCADPTTQATIGSFGTVTSSSIVVNWTRGGTPGDGVIVVAKAGSAPTDPIDGTNYTANVAFGSGTDCGSGSFVVFMGSGTNVTVTGLSASTTYYFEVFEKNCTSTNIKINTTSPASGNQATAAACADPTTQATMGSFGTVTTSSIVVNWTRGGTPGDGVIVVAKAGSAPTDPIDGTNYTANAAFGSGTDCGSGSFVVFMGSGTTVTVTGLSASTTYYFEVFEKNCTGTNIKINTTTPGNGSQATSASSSSNVVISELVDASTFEASFLEIKNAGSSAQDITGWKLYENGTLIETIGSVTLQPCEYMVFIRGTLAQLESLYGTYNGDYYVASMGITANGVDYFELRDASDISIDKMGQSGTTTAADKAYERIDASSDGTNVSSHWNLMANRDDATPGEDNVYTMSNDCPSCTAPTTQATSFTSGSITATTMTVGWTRGNGTAGVIVVARSGSAVNADPVSGTDYTANAAFSSGTQIGTGNYVVYKGTGTSVPVTGLSSNTTYHYAVYEYNTVDLCYNKTELTGNATTSCADPTTQATMGSFGTVTTSSIVVNWTRGGTPGDGVIVVAKAGSAPTDPIDGTNYTANAAFGSGTDCGSNSYVVFMGSGTTVTVTGLSASTTYYFEVFEKNCTGTNIKINTTSPASGNQATAAPTPVITLTPTTLTGFTYVAGSGPSTEQTFTVAGTNLTADISIAAPTNYEISKTSGSGYTTPLTFTQSGGTVSSTTVYVRLKTGLSAGNYNSENITATSTGATNKTVTCSGTVTAAGAPISLWFQGFEGTAADNWNIVTGSSSASTGSGDTPASQRLRTGSRSWQTINASGTLELQSSSVSGYNNLKVIIYVSSTSATSGNGADASDFLRAFVALNGGAFASNSEATSDIAIKGNSNSRWGYNTSENATTNAGTNIVRTGTTGTNAGTIYSKLIINIPDGTSSVALRINTLNDDTNEIWNVDDIEIIGTVAGPTIALSETTLTGFTYIENSGPSAEQSFTVSGSALSANISIAAPTNYEISTGTGATFNANIANPIILNQSGGTVSSTTVYVRLKSGLSIGSYNAETITATSTGATNKTVTCSGAVSGSSTSTLSASATLTEPATNSSIADTPAELFSVFDFTFKDDNGSGGDNIATKISQIVIKQGTGNDVADWTKVIAYAKLVDNNNKELDGTINTTDITFSNISNNTGTPDDLGYIADNTSKTYTLKIYFKTDFGTEKTIIDGKNLVYLVDNSCFVFADPSSNLAATQSVNSGSTKNAIAVVASKLLFSTNKPPATTITNTNTNVEVTATDENGNRDLGSSANITLSKVTGIGSVSSAAGLTKSLSAGLYSWTDFRFSSLGTYTITANDGGSLIDITSGDIIVIDAPSVIWSDNCNPQHTWDVDNGSANWINISPTSNPTAYNGNCYKTAAANSQYGSSKEYILTSEVINMTDYTNCQLSFWMWMSSETNWDGGIVEVNSTGLGGWTKFDADLAYDGTVSVLSTDAWSGTKTTWQKITIDLSVMDGETDLQFRFRFKTDGSVTDFGWAVDEMQLTGVYGGCAGPSTQVSNLSVSNITGTSMDLNFTRGNGTGGVLVVARQNNAVNSDPVSGTTYSAGNFGTGSQIGTGNWVVYNGTGNSCTVAGLTSATDYHFAIYEYNTLGTCYNRNELTGSATTICSTAVNVSGATATPASTIVYIGWTNPTCYDEVMIVAKPTTTISGTPSGDGSAYSAVLNYGGAGTAFDGGKVVYKGATSPQVVYGLTNGTLYYFKIFTRKGSTWSTGVEVSATPIVGTLASNGAGTATATNGSAGNINGTNIWQRNKTSQIANFVITGVSGGWLQNVEIDLSTFSTNLLVANVSISGNAQYGGTTITRTGEVLLINNLNLTNLNTLTVSITGLVTNNILTDTDLGNRTLLVETGNTAGTRAAIASSPVTYLTVPFANAKKYTDNGTTGTLNNKGQIVAVEGISTIASGRLSNNDYDQFFIQEGDGAGAKGLCVRKGSSFTPAAEIAHLYIVKGPLDLISGSITGQTDAFKHMTAINTPTNIIDLGASTLPTPYFVYIETLYAMTYSQFEEVDGLLMRIPSVEKESGSWPALGVSSGLVRMKDVGGTNNLRCYIFGNTDVGGTEPTWPSNMATLVYNYDQFDNYKGRQITPVYKMNFFDEIIWNGSTGNGRWSDALNWSPNILPQQTDEVLFDNITGNANSYSVIYDLASMQTIKSLRINPTIPNNIILNFPNTCTFSPAISINLSGDAVVIENGGIINADFGSTSGDPLTLSAIGTTGKIRINDGGRFIWKADQANEYLIDRLSTAVGTEKGIFEFDIQSSGNEAISVSGKTYGSLVLSASDGNTTYQIQGGVDATIRGDFIINNNVTLDETWGTDFSGTILIGGNLTNNAAAWNINTTQNTPDNLIIFNGSAAQTISTTSTTMNVAGSGFGKKIQISKTSGGVSLASDIKLSETLTMTSGILNTGSYTVDLGTIGTLIETPINPTSYIIGNVRATRNIGIGSQSFGGIGLEIEESSGANSTVVTRVTGTQLQGNATCCAGNWSIARYFDVVPATNSGLNASMKMYYFEHELNSVSETDMQAFKAALPFAGTSPWTNMEGAGNATDNSVRVVGISGFSRWTAAPKANPLPVELVNFSANCTSGVTNLTWSTASEINNDYFDVQKSDDGYSWYSIGEIVGAGNSNKLLTYSFVDKTSQTKAYYRLKQVDFDGKFEYSPIVVNSCLTDETAEIILYPNPASETINISISNWYSEMITFEFTDMLGQTVYKGILNTSEGYAFEQADISNLKPGMYLVRFTDSKQTFNRKIDKK